MHDGDGEACGLIWWVVFCVLCVAFFFWGGEVGVFLFFEEKKQSLDLGN